MPEELDLKRAVEVKEKSLSRLRSLANVTGVGVGYRMVGGERTGETCIRVYVKKKLRKDALAPADIIPSSIEGITVDVIEAEFEVQANGAARNPRGRFNPLVSGVSIGNEARGGSGTLGMTVYDRLTGEQLLLSNWHVLCRSLACKPGETIIQPGTGGGDEGRPEDIVARLNRTGLTRYVDAAVAKLTGHRLLSHELLGNGSVFGATSHALGMRVKKSGRTTGVTEGVVVDVDATVEVGGYPGSAGAGDQGIRLFEHQISVEGAIGGGPISLPGDSGSVFVTQDGLAIGLLFAGLTDGSLATANPIDFVFNQLNVDVNSGVPMQNFISAIA